MSVPPSQESPDHHSPLTTHHSPEHNSPLIQLEHVSLQFGGQQVLRDISLRVERGVTLVVIGESGCGKTVLLKLIIGLLRPTSGRVLFDGRVLTDLDDRELTRARL